MNSPISPARNRDNALQVWLVLGCFAAFTPLTPAQVVPHFDLLDPADGGPPIPDNLVVVDVFVDIAATDVWAAAGLGAITRNQARFLFAMSDDPNDPDDYPYPLFVNPGTADPFVTFGSAPRGRFSERRYTDGGAAVAGSACTAAPMASGGPQWLDLVWFATPPPGPDAPSVDGYVLRIALDVSQACNPETATVIVGGIPPLGYVPLMLAGCRPEQGMGFATWDVPDVSWVRWGVYVNAWPTCAGDVNRDQQIDIRDLASCLSAFGSAAGEWTFSDCADLDANGRVELSDIGQVLSNFGSACP